MCLITNTPVPSIANKDIICYKIYIYSFGEYISPYRRCPIPEINKLVTTEFQDYAGSFTNSEARYCVDLGFHSFVYLSDTSIQAVRISKIFNCKVIVTKCIIQKGSRYYTGKYSQKDSLCSESLIVKDIVDTINLPTKYYD